MYVVLKINNGKPTAWKIHNTMSGLKDKLRSITFCNDEIKNKIFEMIESLPNDGDKIEDIKEYNGYWLIKDSSK